MSNWEKLKKEMQNFIDELDSENIGDIEFIKENIMEYFSSENYSEQELNEAKELNQILSRKLDEKISYYSEEIEKNNKTNENFMKYVNNMTNIAINSKVD